LSVESALDKLISFTFIDSTKVGIQGHSYGGWQTNYLITHSNRFSAACEVAGVSDQISAYGQLQLEVVPRQRFYECESQGSPYGIGQLPWTASDRYVDNSPIFSLAGVSTPLLMIHNHDDGAVPFAQGIEFFMGLRRAGKKVWLLQYDGFGHQLAGDAAKDFHIRMVQFFNYFLKGGRLPSWLYKGIPNYLKGSTDGLEYVPDDKARLPD
jgi:dipeptidyl aminopeptidase/acylaminoacyl peptidase